MGSNMNNKYLVLGCLKMTSIFLFYRFYGKNSSYVHGGLDSNGKPADAVYGQKVSISITSFM